jgi:hypothetical protein
LPSFPTFTGAPDPLRLADIASLPGAAALAHGLHHSGQDTREPAMTVTLTPSLTIRIRRAADHVWRRLETHGRHFSIRCWTFYWLEVLVFRYPSR